MYCSGAFYCTRFGLARKSLEAECVPLLGSMCVYVYPDIYIHIYIHILHTYIHTYIQTYIYTHIHTYVVHKHVQTNVYIYIYIYIYINTHIYIYVCLLISINAMDLLVGFYLTSTYRNARSTQSEIQNIQYLRYVFFIPATLSSKNFAEHIRRQNERTEISQKNIIYKKCNYFSRGPSCFRHQFHFNAPRITLVHIYYIYNFLTNPIC
jgi:hypothetical protein